MGLDKDGVLGGVTSGAFRVAPWHGLGESRNAKGEVVGRKALISDTLRDGNELLVTAGMNWEVEKATLADKGLAVVGRMAKQLANAKGSEAKVKAKARGSLLFRRKIASTGIGTNHLIAPHSGRNRKIRGAKVHGFEAWNRLGRRLVAESA